MDFSSPCEIPSGPDPLAVPAPPAISLLGGVTRRTARIYAVPSFPYDYHIYAKLSNTTANKRRLAIEQPHRETVGCPN